MQKVKDNPGRTEDRKEDGRATYHEARKRNIYFKTHVTTSERGGRKYM